MIGRRIVAAIIDFYLGIIPMFIICNIVLSNVFNIVGKDTDYLAGIAILMLLAPMEFIQDCIEYPYSLEDIAICFSLLLTFLSEVALYSAFDLSPMKRTIGKALMQIEYEHPLTLRCALVRNTIKILTRYLFGIPLIFILFSKKGQTLHDVAIRNSVIHSI